MSALFWGKRGRAPRRTASMFRSRAWLAGRSATISAGVVGAQALWA